MALIRWEPVRELQTHPERDEPALQHVLRPPDPAQRRPRRVRRWIPAMDLVETDDHFVLRADLPGLSEGDVNIELEDNVLTISGERKAEHEERKEGYYRVERSYGSFSRSLTLPEGVDADAVKASFDTRRARGADPEARAAQAAQGRDHASVAARRRRRSRAPRADGRLRRVVVRVSVLRADGRFPASSRVRVACSRSGPVLPTPAPAPARCTWPTARCARRRSCHWRPGRGQDARAARGRRARLRADPRQHVSPAARTRARAGRSSSAACTSSCAGSEPIITDSGGFQVFSMGHGGVADEIKGRRGRARAAADARGAILSIEEEGVRFRSYVDGGERFLGPEGSMAVQAALGSDIALVFDECTPFHVTREYTARSTERTHRWLERCLRWHAAHGPAGQVVYGIVQGGVEQDLRRESAASSPASGCDGDRDRRLARARQGPDARGRRRGPRPSSSASRRTGRATCSGSATSTT